MSGERRVSENRRFGMPCANILVAAFLFSPALAQNSPYCASRSGHQANIREALRRLPWSRRPRHAARPWARRKPFHAQAFDSELAQHDPQRDSDGRHAGIRSAGRHDRCSREPGCVAECVGCREHRAWEPAAGKQFFFGKGQCASCHMVSGEGATDRPRPIEVAREMTVDQLREALLQPDRGSRRLRPSDCAAARWPNVAWIRTKQDQIRPCLAGLEGRASPALARSHLPHHRGKSR